MVRGIDCLVLNPLISVLPKRYTRGKKYPKYKGTEFFLNRSIIHNGKFTTTPEQWFAQRAYGILSKSRIDSVILDSDIDYLKTNFVDTDDFLQLEIDIFSEIFSTEGEHFKF